jgi:hypothetical protein
MTKKTRYTTADGQATYWMDEDGNRFYDQPKDWSLDRDPADMTITELAAALQRDMFGCKPKWWPYYHDWVCTCKDGRHQGDQQCSIVADPPAREVARQMEKLGYLSPPASAAKKDVYQAGLEAVRGLA